MLKKIITNPTIKNIFFHLGLAVLVLVVLGFLVLKFLKVWTNHGEYVVVPDLTKKTLTEVKFILEENKLRYEVLDSTDYNPKFPAYSVIGQNPEPAEHVKENRKIYLTINPSGYRKVTIPKVIQVTRRSAEAILKSVGLMVGKITYVDDIGKDMVLEISYEGKRVQPGEQLIKMSKVDLTCGNGLTASQNSENEIVIPIEELE
ncbi:PASTA domain-containing protein [Capnocytophaga sp.]|uniref:PASTA domain-containing protein n=1 Tax=Capnocytophaga sp. TaxID=44737 RepID=UPI0026DB6722|nr:PASTA domain-containing protein [Capnocytophaga sp.]MDO5105414.1 PASTA domain-containing protein [Capnocytophaga sp.]